ncbi:MAG: tetratricopeptide repeat protein [Gammaproteobacteria bacterium]
MKKWLVCLVASLSLCHVPVSADTFEDALTAFEIGDFPHAVRLLHPLAENGDSSAQYILGQLYEQGKGVNQDYKEAMRWYLNSAIQDHSKAQYHLGRMYETGSGVDRDYVRAYMWYGLASVRGFNVAESNRAYIAQQMTPAQIAEAERLMRECATGVFDACK